jgi:hypothetical protein
MASAPTIQQVLEFVKLHKGIVLADWHQNPGRKVCRVVFPSKVVRRNPQGVKPQVIKDAINTFYPHCDDHGLDHSLIVFDETGFKEVLLMDENIDGRDGHFNYLGLECPTYRSVRRVAGDFLGVTDVLLQVVPEKGD